MDEQQRNEQADVLKGFAILAGSLTDPPLMVVMITDDGIGYGLHVTGRDTLSYHDALHLLHTLATEALQAHRAASAGSN